MTLHEEQKTVQKAMESTLSGLREDPWLTQRVLANAKGEEPVKKKLSTALVLCFILGLAIIGTAYAILSSSQVAEFFGLHWNHELGESLQQGKTAQIGESITIGEVVFTLDEIVYRDRALYGIGTVRPVNPQDVIVPMNLSGDPNCWIENEEAWTLASKADASGGRMLATYAMPLRIGVDEGTLLEVGSVGFYDITNGNGSVTFSFEASDGFAVNEGTSYQLQIECAAWQILENGKIVESTRHQEIWTVSCTPMFMAEPVATAQNQPATIENKNDYELITPQEYQESGTLPVYQAIETDFTTVVDPAWFNQTGIASGAGTDEIHFADHAILNLAPEALFYYEFTDDNYTEAPSNVIVERAWVRNWNGHRGEFTLDRTELTGITLAEAHAQAEAMMTRLGIDSNDYVCTEALDMSLDRILAIGAIWEQAIIDGTLLVDDDYKPYDYGAIQTSEEGFYLKYSPLGIDTSKTGGRYDITFYITCRGIVYAAVRNPFVRG